MTTALNIIFHVCMYMYVGDLKNIFGLSSTFHVTFPIRCDIERQKLMHIMTAVKLI